MTDIRINVKLPDKRMFDGKLFVEAIQKKQLEKTGPDIKSLFEKTVDGWENPPEFMSRQTTTSDSISIRVWAGGPNARQYALVVKGSPEHPIPPGNMGFNVFRPGYRASTSPRILSSRSKQRSGNYVFQYRTFMHPGFKAREFDQEIAERYTPEFEKDMREVFSDSRFLSV